MLCVFVAAVDVAAVDVAADAAAAVGLSHDHHDGYLSRGLVLLRGPVAHPPLGVAFPAVGRTDGIDL